MGSSKSGSASVEGLTSRASAISNSFPSFGFLTSFSYWRMRSPVSLTIEPICACAVSYTHLDVYKRQVMSMEMDGQGQPGGDEQGAPGQGGPGGQSQGVDSSTAINEYIEDTTCLLSTSSCV